MNFRSAQPQIKRQNSNKYRQNENEKLVRKLDFKNSTLGDIFAAHASSIGGLEDGRQTKVSFQKFLFIDQVCCIFDLIGLGLSVIQYDLEFNENDDEVSMWLLWLIFTSSCCLLILTVYRYEAYIAWLKIRKQISNDDNILSSGEFPMMAIELFVYCVIPYPFTTKIRLYFFNSVQQAEAYYHVNEILSLFMISRGFYVIRTVLTMTFWYSNRTQRVCNLYACEGNYMFVSKSLMRTSPYTTQMFAIVSLIFSFGYAVRICEAPLGRNDPVSNNLGLYSNAIWNIIITIMTVGYGDFYTRTDLGRFVIFIVCVMGIFIVSTMVVTLIESLKTTTLESHAITVLERVALRDQLKEEAASCIILMARTTIGWRNGTLSKKQHHNLIIKLKQKLIQFKITLRRYKSVVDSGSLNEEITNQFHMLKKDFDELMENQKKLLSTNQEIMARLGVDGKLLPSLSQA